MNPSDHNHITRDPQGDGPSEYSEEWLSAYVDDELTAAQRAIVEHRIAVDAGTQRLLSELQHMRTLIGQLPQWSGGQIDHARATQRATQSDLLLDAQAFNQTLTEACRAHGEDLQDKLASPASPLPSASHAPRTDVSWWRPVALAACLALLVGGSLWWWQMDATTNLATSATTTEKLAETRPDTELTRRAEPEAARSAEPVRDNQLHLDNQLDLDNQLTRGDELVRGGLARPGEATSGAAAARPVPQLKQAPAGSRFEAMQVEPLQAPAVADRASRSGIMPEGDASERRLGDGRLDRAAGANFGDANSGGARLAGPPSDGRGAGEMKSAANEASESEQRQLLFSAEDRGTADRGTADRGTAGEVQLAHSPGWSAQEVSQALPRLTPLLNLPEGPPGDAADMAQAQVDPTLSSNALENTTLGYSSLRGGGQAGGALASSELASSELASSELASSELASGAPVAGIPIALIAQRPPRAQAPALLDVLSRQSVPLQPIAASQVEYDFSRAMPAEQTRSADEPRTEDKASKAAAAPPYSLTAPPRRAPTLALFVLREEAEQILQTARQSGEMLGNPVWITSATARSTPSGPKQQVVLLFTPQ